MKGTVTELVEVAIFITLCRDAITKPIETIHSFKYLKRKTESK